MPIRLITRRQVAELLPMSKAIELMREGFLRLAEGRAVMPLRQRVATDHGDMLLKPARLPGETLCVKLVMTYPDNRTLGLPSVQGLMLVFDDRTGTPRAVMDAAELTAIRTGAAGGLAIDLLARRDSRSLALIGAGVQAHHQLLGALEVRPIERVFLFDRDPAAAEKLAVSLRQLPQRPEIIVVTDPDLGVAEADIVITATTSPVPTFHGAALRPGTHVNGVGAYQPDRREIDEATMRRAYVVVDGLEAAGIEAGELLIPGIKAAAELAELLTGAKPGRTDERQITVFKSVGMAIQDAVTAAFVLDEAERRSIGTESDLFGD